MAFAQSESMLALKGIGSILALQMINGIEQQHPYIGTALVINQAQQATLPQLH